ncbi:MAG: DNA-deoxyinosine glycosylase [Lautropia sp.]|nr:DNA-deoxyinosine glycosylase [Lautropia sp.]
MSDTTHGTGHSRHDTPPSRHGLPPIWRADARILLLGSFPGIASLTAGAYYAHPRNQFWTILGALLEQPLPDLPYPERLERLRQHRIALWDTVGHCRRRGSLDANIRDAIGNEFQPLLARLPGLKLIAFNGKQAARRQPMFAALGYATAVLPSTSPAHASLNLQQKQTAWLTALSPWLR